MKLDNLTPDALLERIITLEKAHIGEEGEGMTASSVNKVNRSTYNPKDGRGASQSQSAKCKHCGYPHASAACRFKHLKCNFCGVKGHLEAVCFKKSNSRGEKNVKPKSSFVKNVAEESDYSEDDKTEGNLYQVNSITVKPNLYNFSLNDKIVPLEIDSGACVSLLSAKVVQDLGVEVYQSDKKLSAYGGDKIQVVGQVLLNVVYNSKSIQHEFFVTNASSAN